MPPLLSVCFKLWGSPSVPHPEAPVTINKFFQPTEMAAQDFFQRWKQLSLWVVGGGATAALRGGRGRSCQVPDCKLSLPSPQQEAQKIFKANHPMDAEVTKAKVRDRESGEEPPG